MTNVAMAYINAFAELKKAGVPEPKEVWVDRKVMERLDFDLRKISLTWTPEKSANARLRIGDTEFRVKD